MEIPKIIQKIIQKEKLTPQKVISSNFHFFSLLCQNKGGDKLLLKVRLYKKLVKEKNFLKEVWITRFLSKNFYQNPYFFLPKFFLAQTKKFPQWMLREFSPGERGGDTYGFEKKFLQLINPLKIIYALEFIQKEITFSLLKERKQPFFKKWSKNNYLNYFEEFLFKNSPFSISQINQAKKIIRNYSFLLENTSQVIVHQDLHPGNLLYDKKRKRLIFHDWKYFHLGNPLSDFTFLWFMAWQNKIWQKKFFKIALKRWGNVLPFKELFFLNIIILTPKMMKIIHDVSQITSFKRKKGIKHHLQAFNRALNFFKTL